MGNCLELHGKHTIDDFEVKPGGSCGTENTYTMKCKKCGLERTVDV